MSVSLIAARLSCSWSWRFAPMMTEVTTGFAKSQAIESRAGLQPCARAIGANTSRIFQGPLFVHDRKVVVDALRIRGRLVPPAVLAGQQAAGNRTPYEQADPFRFQQRKDFPFEIAAGDRVIGL